MQKHNAEHRSPIAGQPKIRGIDGERYRLGGWGMSFVRSRSVGEICNLRLRACTLTCRYRFFPGTSKMSRTRRIQTSLQHRKDAGLSTESIASFLQRFSRFSCVRRLEEQLLSRPRPRASALSHRSTPRPRVLKGTGTKREREKEHGRAHGKVKTTMKDDR